MRELVACIAAAALLAGCGHTTRYTTTQAALQEARLAERPALPATRDGEPVWIATDRIASEEWRLDGTVEVEARDPRRGLQIVGWAFAAGGIGIGATGLLFVSAAPKGGDGFERIGQAAANAAIGLTMGGIGALLLVSGTGLLLSGYLSDGPEVPPPPSAIVSW